MASRLTNSPKQYKLDAARAGQTSVTPLRQVVEAAVDKTAEDGKPRVLHIKLTAASCDPPEQRFLTTKFASQREDETKRHGQSRKLAQTQQQGAVQQVHDLAAYLRDLPGLPRAMRRSAQDLARQCNDATLFGLPCNAELLMRLQQLESAQLAQRSQESTPRQTEHTPRPEPERPQPLQPADAGESSTASQTNASQSEESPALTSAPGTNEVARKPRQSKAPALLQKQPAQNQKVQDAREQYLTERKLDGIQDLQFPDTPGQSRRTRPTTLSSSQAPLPLASTSPPQSFSPRSSEPVTSDTPPPTRKLPSLPTIQNASTGTGSSDESPHSTAIQSDRPKSTKTTEGDESTIIKSQSTPTSPTPASLNPPTSPRSTKLSPLAPKPRFLGKPSATDPRTPPTPRATPRSPHPSADPSSPIKATNPEAKPETKSDDQ